jgi:hypothetical protein
LGIDSLHSQEEAEVRHLAPGGFGTSRLRLAGGRGVTRRSTGVAQLAASCRRRKSSEKSDINQQIPGNLSYIKLISGELIHLH